MGEPLSVAIIGLGHLHPRSYVPIIKAVEDLNLVAVADANADLLAAFGKDFNLRTYADYREMIAKEKLDLAAIFLPHAECPAAAAACAERGIHLLVEKPMAAERRRAAAPSSPPRARPAWRSPRPTSGATTPWRGR